MTLPIQELRSIRDAYDFLLDISSGQEKRIPSATRKRARDIVKHFPFPIEASKRYEDAGAVTEDEGRRIWDRDEDHG